MSESDPRSAHERAEVLQLDAALHELAGVAPHPDLLARVLARCQVGPDARPVAAPRVPWWWAAAIAAGLAVVGAVAWLRHVERSATVAPIQEPKPQDPAPQDPKPAPAPAAGRWVTLLADYSDNRVFAIDEAGAERFRLDDVFGVWDAELLPNGNVLLTEFSVSRVREVTQEGKTVWQYENLKNPYDADRLTLGHSAGNTLICDTFANRILEVKPDGTTFWSYGDHEHETIRPFDCDQTPEGNFLIADQLGERVVEINYHGFVIWEAKNLPSVHDADRLPNGHTLVTLRGTGGGNRGGEVRELDREGKLVWSLKDLEAPSDADRLPNGNTLVAENKRVREYDPSGKVVWERPMTWAVEANRYAR